MAIHTQSRSLFLRLTLALACFFLFFFTTTRDASAAADYIRSEPSNGKTIAATPPSVTIQTSERLRANDPGNTLFVYGPTGELVSKEEARVSVEDPTLLQVAINNLGPGTYIVHWTTVSDVDGQKMQGAFTFIVDPSIAASQNREHENDIPLFALLVSSIVALILGFIIGSGWNRNRNATIPHVVDNGDDTDDDNSSEQFSTEKNQPTVKSS